MCNYKLIAFFVFFICRKLGFSIINFSFDCESHVANKYLSVSNIVLNFRQNVCFFFFWGPVYRLQRVFHVPSAAWLHVDDVLCCSRAFCEDCIGKGLQRISNFLGSFVVLSQQTFTVISIKYL